MAYSTVQFKKFAQAAIPVGLLTIYTVPAASQDVLKGIDIANTNSTTTLVTVHLIPSGSSASATTQLVPNASIVGNSLFHWTGTQVLNTGDFIQVTASGTGCSINISGLEST